MKIKFIYCLVIVFCISLVASSKNNTAEGKDNVPCKMQTAKALIVEDEKMAAGDDEEVVEVLPLTHFFFSQI
jgi:hypothetical protein